MKMMHRDGVKEGLSGRGRQIVRCLSVLSVFSALSVL